MLTKSVPICTGVMTTAATVLKDQADADQDMSIGQRLALAGGSALEGAGDAVGIEGVTEVLQVAGLPFVVVCDGHFLAVVWLGQT